MADLKSATKAREGYDKAAESAAKNNQLDIAPDTNYKPNEAGERGTSALPEGHPARKGLDVERSQGTYPGAEKFGEDVIVDFPHVRMSRAVDQAIHEFGPGNVGTKADK